jgi:DNA repair ATPase RecN
MTDVNDALGVDRKRASAVTQVDRDRMLEAMHALEEAAGRPASGQSEVWTQSIAAALERLECAFAEQRASYQDPIGLMAEIANDDPRLRTWVRQLRHRWIELEATAHALRQTLESSADLHAISEVRERVRWLTGAIRHHREREADLVFSALEIELEGSRDP